MEEHPDKRSRHPLLSKGEAVTLVVAIALVQVGRYAIGKDTMETAEVVVSTIVTATGCVLVTIAWNLLARRRARKRHGSSP